MIPLQAMTPRLLAERLPAVTLAEARKVVAAVHRGDDLARPIKEVRRTALDAVRRGCFVPEFELAEERQSADLPFVKYAFRLEDGEVIETVRIPLERAGRYSVCVSSQVGCALSCAFCATGRMGLRRNLEAWEIVEQVRRVKIGLAKPARVHGVVFQGMGEPLANLDRVLEALAVLSEPAALAIDARNITVCTSGNPTGIRRLAQEAPKVRLGLSIGSARPTVRRELMPVDRAHSLEEVLEASVFHAKTTGYSPMWAVTPLLGINDFEEDARALATLAQRFTEQAGKRPRISVIPYNSIDPDDDPFHRTTEAREEQFREAMREVGVATHKRYSGGSDFQGACGQLARKG